MYNKDGGHPFQQEEQAIQLPYYAGLQKFCKGNNNYLPDD